MILILEIHRRYVIISSKNIYRRVTNNPSTPQVEIWEQYWNFCLGQTAFIHKLLEHLHLSESDTYNQLDFKR
jgi:hypothetical protein